MTKKKTKFNNIYYKNKCQIIHITIITITQMMVGKQWVKS